MGPSAAAEVAGIRQGPVAASNLVIIGSTNIVATTVEAAMVDLERYLGTPGDENGS